MNYEKKYKEMKARVLEIGRGYVKGVDFSKPRQIAEYIFPELKESEDEMIRKAIIDFFSEPGRKEYILNGFTVDSIIAWLEKQCEQKQDFNYHDYVCRDAAIRYLESIKSPHDVARQHKEEVIDWLNSLEKRIQPQHKQEWSEDDEKMFDKIYSVLHQYGYASHPEVQLSSNDAVKLIVWLKSIKERVRPQSKQEWSEEDEKNMNKLLKTIDVNSDINFPRRYFNDEEASILRDWLKSLKPNHWKPSEKQMEELARITRGNSYPHLSSLYNELKKL